MSPPGPRPGEGREPGDPHRHRWVLRLFVECAPGPTADGLEHPDAPAAAMRLGSRLAFTSSPEKTEPRS